LKKTSLPEDEGDQIKKHLVLFQPSGQRGEIDEGTTIINAARQLGVGIETICGGARTCGKCRVQIEEGKFEKAGIVSSLSNISLPEGREKDYITDHNFQKNERLACDTRIHGPLVIFLPETSRVGRQIIRKSATIRSIDLDPAVRIYYVEVPRPSLSDEGLSDLDRLKNQLHKRFGLQSLELDYHILLELQRILREKNFGVTVSVWKDHKIINIRPGFHDKCIGLAVDIGTTTVAAYLCDLSSGEVLSTQAAMNPQVAYGEDIMSRISYVVQNPEGLANQNKVIIKTINKLATDAAEQAGLNIRDIDEVVLVGNTVMHHIALNIDPTYLGGSPFPICLSEAVDIPARDLGLEVNPAANVFVLPVKSSYVGADNMGVVLAEMPHEQDEIMLIIDVGTNGELLLGSKRRLLSASSPTGPAFEGAQITFGMRAAEGAIEKVRIDPETFDTKIKVIGREEWSDHWVIEKDILESNPSNKTAKKKHKKSGSTKAKGICGSGIIDAVAEMYRAGILLETGAFNPDLSSPRLSSHNGIPAYILAYAYETEIGRDIVLTIADVRAVQLAKAALYTGAQILMKNLGMDRVDKVVLAGAFGSYMDKERSIVLGMIPDCPMEKVYSVGNAAGDGARIALLNKVKREEISRVARWIEHIHIPMAGEFQDLFIEALAFPNLEKIKLD
jgi:uncharacterized 2Fe-2S/4Fe-4S cluster protein (DUF4445 family)